MVKCEKNCLWYDQCKQSGCLMFFCDDYCPTGDDLTDEELLNHKYEYRSDFFSFAEEIELFE